MNLNGIEIVESELAVDTKEVFKITPVPIKKRRKGWRVIRQTITSPGCWMVGGVAYMHPEIFKKLNATP